MPVSQLLFCVGRGISSDEGCWGRWQMLSKAISILIDSFSVVCSGCGLLLQSLRSGNEIIL